jgi:hypothetical protein
LYQIVEFEDFRNKLAGFMDKPPEKKLLKKKSFPGN